MQLSHSQPVHPLWLRCCHWVNAVAIAGMLFSGWRIYNASPLFHFKFPTSLTLGGWLGGALQWHFALMWVLVINGAVYFLLGVASERFRRKFFPLSWPLLKETLPVRYEENCSTRTCATIIWCKNRLSACSS